VDPVKTITSWRGTANSTVTIGIWEISGKARAVGSIPECHAAIGADRRLAAILVLDVVGSSRPIERDERGTI
jgi:hypothetical protein